METMFPACQMAMREGVSRLTYQDDDMRQTAGKKGPSVTPTRNLQSMKPQADLTAGMQIVMADQASIQQGRTTRGRLLAMKTLPGTWVKMYPT